MPVQHLGQLSPTMKQQIALQKALLALAREDEELRRKVAARDEELRRKVAAQRVIRGPSQGLAPTGAYAGPTPTLDEGKSPLGIYPELAKGYFKPEGGLMGALTGGAPDMQADAWARRKETVEANQAKLDTEADALYGLVQNLSKKDQDYILGKIVSKGKDTGALITALGGAPTTESVTARAERYEREGKGWTPEEQALHYAELNKQNPGWDKTAPYARKATSLGVTDPLMKTMLNKNYVKKTATGYAWMLPEKEKKVVNINQWTDESGWLNQTTTFDDSTTKTEIIGREAKEKEKEATISEVVALGRLAMDKAKAAKGEGDAIIDKALKLTGPRYGKGEIVDGKKYTKTQVEDWNKRFTDNYNMLSDLYGGTPSIPTGELSLDMIPDTTPGIKQRKEEIALYKAQYEDRPDIIMTIEQMFGMASTGKWSPQLEYMLFTYGMGGK